MFDFLPGDIKKIGKGMIRAIVLFFVAIYVISPIDLMPGLPFDDIVVAVVGLSFVGIDVKSLLGSSREARVSYQTEIKKKTKS